MTKRTHVFRTWRGARAVLLAVLAAASPAALMGQPPESQSVLEENQRVTAVDVLVELDAVAASGDQTRGIAKRLEPGDFEIRIDGEPRPVVGFFDPRGRWTRERQAAGDEPWSIVLYFDLDLAQRDTVRWAAGELVELVPELVELGDVELVVAGQGERRGVKPTRDEELLIGELSGLAINPRGGHALIEMRAEALDALRDDPEVLDEPGVVEALVGQEVELVERSLDELLLHLIDRDAPTAKRALFWVADGFDLEPEGFYLGQLSGKDGTAADRVSSKLRDLTARFSVTLASYGWVTLSLSPPAADAGLVPGFRLGKWLFGPPGEGPFFLKLTREARRDPDKADGHFQLGRAHLASGAAEEAEREFERALYHYAGDPRTAKRQAAAKAALGRALEEQGAIAEARQAFRHAVELDPSLAPRLPQSRPRLLEPLAFQQILEASTAGRLVEDAEQLVEALASLRRRARLTYQVSGIPQGEVRKLEVLLADSELELRYPTWTRSGTPSGVAAARARELARGEIEGGGLLVRAELSEEDRMVRIELDPESLEDRESLEFPLSFRVTVATGRSGEAQNVRYRRFAVSAEEAGPTWLFRMPVTEVGDDATGELGVAVIVEDLASGRWGGDLVN